MERPWATFAFLTVLPGPDARGRREQGYVVRPGIGYFPLVGLLVGVLQSGAWWAVSRGFGPELAAAAAIGTGLLATRGLHWDGWLDSCDALFGGHDRQRRLEILRDSHAGAFAVVGAVWTMLVQWVALSYNPSPPAALLLAATASRWAMAVAVVAFPAARAEGLAAWIKREARWVHVGAASLVASGAAAALAGTFGLVSLAAAGLVGMAFGWWAYRLLGGLTGDQYGAVQVLAETSTLLLLASRGR